MVWSTLRKVALGLTVFDLIFFLALFGLDPFYPDYPYLKLFYCVCVFLVCGEGIIALILRHFRWMLSFIGFAVLGIMSVLSHDISAMSRMGELHATWEKDYGADATKSTIILCWIWLAASIVGCVFLGITCFVYSKARDEIIRNVIDEYTNNGPPTFVGAPSPYNAGQPSVVEGQAPSVKTEETQ